MVLECRGTIIIYPVMRSGWSRSFAGRRPKYYLSNLPPSASFKKVVTAIKARWSCEQTHQQMKEELGLDHFEGRSWHGLHHQAVLGMIAFAFLQHLRLRAKHS